MREGNQFITATQADERFVLLETCDGDPSSGEGVIAASDSTSCSFAFKLREVNHSCHEVHDFQAVKIYFELPLIVRMNL